MKNKVFTSRLFFVLAILFLVFLVGFASSHFRFFPYSFLSRALNQAKNLTPVSARNLHHMHRARNDLVGVVAYDESGRAETARTDSETGAYVLLTSYWPWNDWRPGIELIDRAGEVVHTWDVDIMAIWPESPHHDAAKGLLHHASNYVHGTYLFENGDVIFNVEYLGLVRMNAAGQVVWRLDRRTHHSIHQTLDGNFWVCEAVWIDSAEEVARRFPGLIPPLIEDRALEVSPEGEVLREISILEVLCRSEHRKRLWAQGLGGNNLTTDVLHLNDVEPLPESMAGEYPLFEAGDLMVSLRHQSFIMVFDPDTKKVKWALGGEILAQHDPDFIGDGWISIFDNNLDGSLDGHLLGGSRLLAVRPHTHERRQIYPRASSRSEHERRFYSGVGGKAQALRGGHWLITEPTGARVFEIDAAGRTIWEWGHQRHDDGRMVSEVLEGTCYYFSPEIVRRWRMN